MRPWLVLLLVAGSAHAAPLQLTHQGRLLDSAGQSLQGSHTLDISLFTVPSDGTAIWTESDTVVLDDGYYATVLGDSTVLDPDYFAGESLYLEISVAGAGVTTPRTRLLSVPYAIQSGGVHLTADQVDDPCTTSASQGLLRYEGGVFQGCTAAGWVDLGRNEPEGSAARPAETCYTLHQDYPTLGSGPYWLDPDGDGPIPPFQGYCEMAMADGGWTLVGRQAGNSTSLANTGVVGALTSPTQNTTAKLSDTVWNALIRQTGTRIVPDSYGGFSEPWMEVRVNASNISWKGSTVGTGCEVRYSKGGWYTCMNNGFCGGDVAGQWGGEDGGTDEIRWAFPNGCGMYLSGGVSPAPGTAWVR